MFRYLSVRAVCIAIVVGVCAGLVQAGPYPGIVVLGDSLSDVGNTYSRTWG